MTPERIDAALIREAVRVQRDKTLLAVRDLADRIRLDEPSERSYGRKVRSAKQFRDELVAGLEALGKP